jgi:two-component system sensor histidine kinase/response regulator
MSMVLVIDDDEDVRSTIASMLEIGGFEVTTARDGIEALTRLQSSNPDVVLSDVNMPGMDGYRLVDEIRKTTKGVSLPIVLMTGRPDFDGMRQGMDRGADDYLPKPFSAAELQGVVRRHLQKKESLEKDSHRRMETLRSQISLMLPHELLTPLNGILGIADMLVENAVEPDELAQYGRMLRKSGERLHHLVQNFLVYAQIEMLAADPERLSELRKNPGAGLAVTLSTVAKSKAVAWERPGDLHLELHECDVAVGEEHLKMIVSELIDNAFKFSAAGSQVRCASRPAGAMVEVEVSDRGRGMTVEHVAGVGAYMQFERRFYEQQGAGLGLIIARRLAELHGGKFSIESEQGTGTTVKLLLPEKR